MLRFLFKRLWLIFTREQQGITQIMTVREVQRLGKQGHGLGPGETASRPSGDAIWN